MEPRFGHDFTKVRVHTDAKAAESASAVNGQAGECAECSKKKMVGLQTKLKVNEPGDVYEREADRIADQVMATPADPSVSGAPPHIQRFSGQSNGHMDVAPASVDQALASPGRPLEPALRQDMEQRFGHDFSRVRVHLGAAAEQSAREVNAHAYTVGHSIVFDAGRFAPGTQEGRRLIAHELTHVVQQTGSDGMRVIDRRGLTPISSAQHSGVERLAKPTANETPMASVRTPIVGVTAHELSHVVQQTGKIPPQVQRQANPSKVVFQQTIPDPNPNPSRLFPSTPSMPLLQVVATPSEGWIIYNGRYKIKLRVSSDVISERIPFAYQFSPPTPQRNYPIIHIIAGPGVSIQFEGFPEFYALTPNNTIPAVEIIRAQSLNQVPPIGTQFSPSDYTGLKAVETPSERSEQQVRQRFGLPPLPPDIAVHQRPDGLDIVQVSSKQVLRIKTPNLRGDTAFVYEVIPERLFRESRMQRVVVKLIKTPAVEVALHTPFMDLRTSAHGLVFGIVPIVYEVNSVRDIPTQGLPIPSKGRQVNVKHEMQESLSRIVATTAIDAAIGFTPVVGDLVDIAEFTYGIFTGYDRWGRPSLERGFSPDGNWLLTTICGKRSGKRSGQPR